jgi:hypothetical protein
MGGIILHMQIINIGTTRPKNDVELLTLDLTMKKEDATMDHQPQVTPLVDVSHGPSLARKDNYKHASRKEKKVMRGTESERLPLHTALANL